MAPCRRFSHLSFHGTVWAPPNVEYLSLDSVGLLQIPPEITALKQLKELDFHSLMMNYHIPDSICQLTAMTKLCVVAAIQSPTCLTRWVER